MTIGSRKLFLHSTIMWPEAVITMMWPLSSKEACNRYNILDMEKDGKNLNQKFVNVEFQIFPTKYHTWGCPVLVLRGSPTGRDDMDIQRVTKGKDRSITCTLTVSCRVIRPDFEHKNWTRSPTVTCGI